MGWFVGRGVSVHVSFGVGAGVSVGVGAGVRVGVGAGVGVGLERRSWSFCCVLVSCLGGLFCWRVDVYVSSMIHYSEGDVCIYIRQTNLWGKPNEKNGQLDGGSIERLIDVLL